MAYNVRFSIGGFNADMECWQWGYTDTTQYLTRNYGTSAYGQLYRDFINVTRQVLVVTFLRQDSVIDALRTLSMLALRTTQPVTFYQDYPSGGMVLDWPSAVERQVIIENRAAIELTIMEQV